MACEIPAEGGEGYDDCLATTPPKQILTTLWLLADQPLLRLDSGNGGFMTIAEEQPYICIIYSLSSLLLVCLSRGNLPAAGMYIDIYNSSYIYV